MEVKRQNVVISGVDIDEKRLFRVKYLDNAKLERAVQPGEGVQIVWKVLCKGRAGLPDGTAFALLEKGKKGWVEESEDKVAWKHVIQGGLDVGQVLDIPLTITCPTEGGKHKFFWALRSPSGLKIGKRVSCSLYVQDANGGDVLKKGKKEKREKRVREKKSKAEEGPFVWPENVTHVFLDGNNMLYVPSRLRSLMIHRNRKRAETILNAYAQKFASITGVPNTTLVFDHSSLSEYEEDTLINAGEDGEKKKHFALKCAHRAGFAIADDALVQWITELKQKIPEASVLCVTSDRGLIERLQGNAQTVKPGRWFKHTRELISGPAAAQQDVVMGEQAVVPEAVQQEGVQQEAAQQEGVQDSFDAFFDAWVNANVGGTANKRVKA